MGGDVRRPITGALARLRSVNTGRARDVPWEGRTVRTSIFRSPRPGPVALTPSGLEGDEVSDRSVHGGPSKTVYAYPAEHYPYWSGELAGVPLPWGSFGENLTTEGLEEGRLRPGDVLSIGTAELIVTQPRGPCMKLNVRFHRRDVLPKFLRSDRPGFYLGVVRPGTVTAGDEVVVTPSSAPGPTILEIFRSRSAGRA
jgi:MOSC domain-containing protein YiiM